MLAGGIYERTSGAAGQPLGRGYQRREPERTVLHELMSRHAQTMLAELRASDCRGLPRHVERELAEYLRCGIRSHGFARVRCQTCNDEILVAFSCKRRGICPSCTARRMADTAAHLVENVLTQCASWQGSARHFGRAGGVGYHGTSQFGNELRCARGRSV